MIKQLALIMMCGLMVVTAAAQSDIVTTGGEASSNAGSVSYTIGQIAVQSVENGSATLTEGVQQPFEIQIVGVDNYPNITLDARVYPNPTADRVTLTVNTPVVETMCTSSLHVALYNNNGQYIRTVDITATQTDIDMTALSAGTYYLRVTDGRQTLKTFKVVKTM